MKKNAGKWGYKIRFRPSLLYNVKSEREKQILYINACIWNLENGTDEPIDRAVMEI